MIESPDSTKIEQIKTETLYDNAAEQATQIPEINKQDYNILDIGCGGVPYFAALNEQSINLKNTRYIGVDSNLKEIERAKKFVEHYPTNPTKIDFFIGDGKELPFENASFNEIVFRNIFGDPEIGKRSGYGVLGFLDEAYRVLKDNGKLIIIETYTPNIAKENLLKAGLIETEKLRRINNTYTIDPSLDNIKLEPFIMTFEKIPQQNDR